jgi:hypothetical protein
MRTVQHPVGTGASDFFQVQAAHASDYRHAANWNWTLQRKREQASE